MRVAEREENGRAKLLEISGENLSGEESSVSIEGEYDIRRAMAPEEMIQLQDGSVCEPMQLLPSAWFAADEIYGGPEWSDVDGNDRPEWSDADGNGGEEQSDAEGSRATVFRLTGGGFGHGNGLSQNGAACMARQGMSCQEILEFYYPDTQISKVGGMSGNGKRKDKAAGDREK